MKKWIWELGRRTVGNLRLVRRARYYYKEDPKVYWIDNGRAAEEFIAEVRKDMVCALFRYGCTYEDYFLYNFFEKKDHAYRKTFITDLDRFVYAGKCNPWKNQLLFNDKLWTYEMFGKYYGRELLSLTEDSLQELDAFIKRHPRIIAKPNGLSRGAGVELIDTTTYASTQDLLHYLISTEHFVIEEVIKQSPELAKLHPSSANCARVATFLVGKEGNYEVEVFHPFLKIGRHGSIIDNGISVRGIVVKIDMQTGMLCTDGCDEAGMRFTEHPETGVVFKGYQLPDWEQAVQMVKELALILPSSRYMAWDLAHTEAGWVVVEGNGSGQLIGQQMADVVGRKPELDAIMKRI